MLLLSSKRTDDNFLCCGKALCLQYMASPHCVGSNGKAWRTEVLSILYIRAAEGQGLTIGGAAWQAWLTTGNHAELTAAHNNHPLSSIFPTASMILIYILVIKSSRKTALKTVERLTLECALLGMHDVERSNRRVSSRSRWMI